MVSARVRPGALEPRVYRAGSSLRRLAREADLSLNTVLAACAGKPIAPTTRYKLGIWLRNNPALESAELDELIVVEEVDPAGNDTPVGALSEGSG